MSRKSRNKRRKKSRKGNRGFTERSGCTNRHHNFAKCRGHNESINNIIIMDTRRHQAFHLLFGVRTFREAAILLLRVERAKKNQTVVNIH
jgi:hypothetical protein